MNNAPRIGERFFTTDGLQVHFVQRCLPSGEWVPSESRYAVPKAGWIEFDANDLPFREDLNNEFRPNERPLHLHRIQAAIKAGHFAPPPPPKAPAKDVVETLTSLLANLAAQADEDCPGQCRSRHFRDALDDAYAFLGVSLPERDQAPVIGGNSNSTVTEGIHAYQ